METIEFRAWHNKSGQMLSQAQSGINFIHPNSKELLSAFDKDLNLMQFSGLFDQNQQKIFVGDLIETNRSSLLEVQFDSGCFLVNGIDSVHGKPIRDWLNAFASWSKVVGNIYTYPSFDV